MIHVSLIPPTMDYTVNGVAFCCEAIIIIMFVY